MKIAMSEMNNTVIRIKGRLDITEEKICEPEDVGIETIQVKTLRNMVK